MRAPHDPSLLSSHSRARAIAAATFVAWALLSPISPDPAASAPDAAEAASPGAAPRIEAGIRDWFRLLEHAEPASPTLLRFLGHPDLVLRFREETLRGREQGLAWAARVRDGFTRVVFQIGPIQISEEAPGVLRARFEENQSAWDDEGLLHLSRRQHTWRIVVGDATAPTLLEARDVRALPHPGTGSQLICL